MKFDTLSNRLEELERGLHAGLIATTDKDGKRAWLKHSGISAYREILHAEHLADKAGHEFTKADLTPELLEELDLWTRAELTEGCGALAEMIKTEATRILETVP